VIEIKADSSRLSAALRELIHRCRDMRPAWEVVGNDLLRSVDANFDAEGRPSAWDAWSPGYGKWRAKKKPGKVLTLDGRLRRSVTHPSAISADRNGVTLGTNVVYAAIHHFGGEIKIKAGQHKVSSHERARRTKSGNVARRGGKAIRWGVREFAATRSGHTVTIPARPFLVVQDSDWPKIVKTIGDHVAGAWG
jgi:phage virion morphogenesis protein